MLASLQVCYKIYIISRASMLKLSLIFFSFNMRSSIIPGLVLLLLLAASNSEAAISCTDVVKDLRPCLNYLTSGSGKPPAGCCAGVSALQSAASTAADRRTACSCIKTAAQKINPNAQLAQALPANCGIKLPFTVSPNVDCSKIK